LAAAVQVQVHRLHYKELLEITLYLAVSHPLAVVVVAVTLLTQTVRMGDQVVAGGKLVQ
jgi:hypothetical protein